MGTLFVSILVILAFTADGYVVHKTPRDTPYTLTQTSFMYLPSGNYAVRVQQGYCTCEVREMKLKQDVWVVMYTKPLSNQVVNNLVCSDDLKSIPQERIIKIYNNQTVITNEDVPDRWTVANNTIVCFLVLQNHARTGANWGDFTYKFDDPCTKPAVLESRPFYSSKTIAVWKKQLCYPMRDGYSTVIDFQKTLGNRTSLDRVMVTVQSTRDEQQCSYVSRYQRGRYRQVYECSKVQKTVYNIRQMITGQTPPNSLRNQWPLVLKNGSHVCFEYEAVETNVLGDDMLFRVSEFPDCNGDVTNRSGIVVSPGYPLTLYNNNISCSWTIKVQPNERIRVNFGHTKSDCGNDYILLSGVEGGSRNTELLCGRFLTGRTFMSVSNELIVKFQTNKFKNLKGFLLTYEVSGCSLEDAVVPANFTMLNRPNGYIPPGFVLRIGCQHGYVFPSKVGEVELECAPDNTWLGDIPFCVEYVICNNTLTAPAGHVTSPGYPHSYPKDLRCSWTIKTKPGKYIRLVIEDIKSNCANDYIIIEGVQKNVTTTTTPKPAAAKEGSNAADGPCARSSANRNEYICGDSVTAGMVYTSVDHTVVINFRSYVYQDIGYFNISFKALGCSTPDLRKPNAAILRNPARFYPVHYRLVLGCPDGLSFPGGIGRVFLVCNRMGTWTGKIPFCVRWRAASCEDSIRKE